MRRHRRLTTAAAIGALALIGFGLSSPAASADTVSAQGNGSVSSGQVTATASSSNDGHKGRGESGSGGSPSGDSGSAPTCTYVPVNPRVAAALPPGGPTPGNWYFSSCQISGLYGNPSPPTWVPAGPIWIPTGQPLPTGPAGPSVPGLIDIAESKAALVTPTIVLDPQSAQVVNLATWLAIPPSDWHDVTASASAGPVTATVQAVPIEVLWNMGDGQSVTCSGPGTIYDPAKPASLQSSDCTYTWRVSSANQPEEAFRVSATIVYSVTTSVVGAPDPTPSLGDVSGPSSSELVEVTEVEALGTAAGGG